MIIARTVSQVRQILVGSDTSRLMSEGGADFIAGELGYWEALLPDELFIVVSDVAVPEIPA